MTGRDKANGVSDFGGYTPTGTYFSFGKQRICQCGAMESDRR